MANPVVTQEPRSQSPLPSAFDRFRPDISAAMRERLDSDSVGAYPMLRYNMGWVDTEGNEAAARGGKALRPTLCLLACEAAGGNPEVAMPAAVSLEFIHNFSLVHDDIQDRDTTRWGRPTLWSVWGEPKALVAGNVLRAVADMALWELLELGADYTDAVAVTSLLTEGYLQMIEGQYLDVAFEGQHDITLPQYLDMIARKTGALIRCSMHIGAVIGSTDHEAAYAFREFGRSLGYVFQIRDDVLGTWGDEETFGKPVGSDIRRKKNALPIVHAMSQAKGSSSERLRSVYEHDNLDDADVDVVLEIMEEVGSKSYADALAVEHCERAIAAISHVEMSPESRAQIEGIADFLLVREH